MAGVDAGTITIHTEVLKYTLKQIGVSDRDIETRMKKLREECLDLYYKKLKLAETRFNQLSTALKEKEAELMDIYDCLGEPYLPVIEGNEGLLKKLNVIDTHLTEKRKVKSARLDVFLDTVDEIEKISLEVGCPRLVSFDPDYPDLSFENLNQLKTELTALENEKAARENRFTSLLNNLTLRCSEIGLNLEHVLSLANCFYHKDEQCDDLSDRVMERVELAIDMLPKTKDEIENFMAERNKTKSIIEKKQALLEGYLKQGCLENFDIYKSPFQLKDIDSGKLNPLLVLEDIDSLIDKAESEIAGRACILEKVNRWINKCKEEEAMSGAYNEVAKHSSQKISISPAHKKLSQLIHSSLHQNPGLLEGLIADVEDWEKRNENVFLYDGLPLLEVLLAKKDNKSKKKVQREVVQSMRTGRYQTRASLKTARGSLESIESADVKKIKEHRACNTKSATRELEIVHGTGFGKRGHHNCTTKPTIGALQITPNVGEKKNNDHPSTLQCLTDDSWSTTSDESESDDSSGRAMDPDYLPRSESDWDDNEVLSLASETDSDLD